MHAFSGDRMEKREAVCVEGDAADRVCRSPVFFVSHNRASHVRQVHAYLVLTPCLKDDIEERMRFI